MKNQYYEQSNDEISEDIGLFCFWCFWLNGIELKDLLNSMRLENELQHIASIGSRTRWWEKIDIIISFFSFQLAIFIWHRSNSTALLLICWLPQPYGNWFKFQCAFKCCARMFVGLIIFADCVKFNQIPI